VGKLSPHRSNQPDKKAAYAGVESKVRVFVRVSGMALLILGILCMPVGFGVSPKRDQSAFNNLADMRAFLLWGAVLGGSGVILLIVGAILPSRPDD
jgi:hypothetical protein